MLFKKADNKNIYYPHKISPITSNKMTFKIIKT